MLANIKNDLMYLLNIIEGIEKIFIYTGEFNNAEDFYNFQEQMNFNATLNLFGMIGENTGKISNELKEKYVDINWREIKDFRNKVVHNYVNVDMFIVFNIIKRNLPQLKNGIEEIIGKELLVCNFDIKEYELSKNSIYYRHINYEKIEQNFEKPQK